MVAGDRPKTAADYAAIAVAPLLILLMINSLANFLMLVLYHGNQPQRVAWTLFFFTMGTVGIARVAIEKDRASSLGYGGILGLVAFVAMLRFVDSPIFSAFMLAVIGYLSDRIVHDCTLIDESVDASGQGLIDSGRLFVKQRIDNDQGLDSDEDSSNRSASGGRGTHQPGRTVMYLALAALPLFGMGQFFLRGDDATWHRALWLLAVYLFSSLSLLVTTSFLGLRRYLRQRRVDMPTDVSIGWLSGGLMIIGAILMIAYMVPMPGQALASLKLPAVLDSPGDLNSSRFGWGEEGADRSNPGDPSTATDADAQDKEIQSIRSESGAPPGPANGGQREDGPPGGEQGGDQSGGGGDQQSEQSSDEGKSSQSSASGENQQSSQSGDQNDQQQSESESSAPSDSDSQSEDQSDEESQSEDQRDEESQSHDPGGSDQQNPPPEDPSDNSAPNSSDQSESSAADSEGSLSQVINSTLSALSGIMRALIMLVLLSVVGYYLWIHREAIAAWWRSLFAGRSVESADESITELVSSDAGAPPRHFSSFRNPFGKEKDPRRIVVITFQAFEAWSREQGSIREKDETPSEFIGRIAKSLPNVAPHASQVVQAYNRIVYGRGNASQRDLSAAKTVWTAMER